MIALLPPYMPIFLSPLGRKDMLPVREPWMSTVLIGLEAGLCISPRHLRRSAQARRAIA